MVCLLNCLRKLKFVLVHSGLFFVKKEESFENAGGSYCFVNLYFGNAASCFGSDYQEILKCPFCSVTVDLCTETCSVCTC